MTGTTGPIAPSCLTLQSRCFDKRASGAHVLCVQAGITSIASYRPEEVPGPVWIQGWESSSISGWEELQSRARAWVMKSKELRPFCNVFTSQVEGVLVAITQVNCYGIGSNSSWVLIHTTKSCPSHLHTGKLLAGAAGRGAGPDPGPAQALSCHSELHSQMCIDRVQGSRGQVGHMLFLSGQPENLHRAPTKCQILFLALSGDSAQKDKTVSSR